MDAIELIRNTEAGEPGAFALLNEEGVPMYKGPDGDFPGDYPAVAGALKNANTEAKLRRQAIEQIAAQVGLERPEVDSPDTLAAILAQFDSNKADTTELDRLSKLEASGKLDKTADEQVRAMAIGLNKETIAKLTASESSWKLEAGKEKAKGDQARSELSRSKVTTACRVFFDGSKSFREGALQAFLQAAQMRSEEGLQWRPSGSTDSAGIPVLVYSDDAGTRKLGPDGVKDLTMTDWAESELKTTWPILFNSPNGSPSGVTPGGSQSTKNAGDMTKEEIRAEARRAYS